MRSFPETREEFLYGGWAWNLFMLTSVCMIAYVTWFLAVRVEKLQQSR